MANSPPSPLTSFSPTSPSVMAPTSSSALAFPHSSSRPKRPAQWPYVPARPPSVLLIVMVPTRVSKYRKQKWDPHSEGYSGSQPSAGFPSVKAWKGASKDHHCFLVTVPEEPVTSCCSVCCEPSLVQYLVKLSLNNEAHPLSVPVVTGKAHTTSC